jgi:hypothetical protein
MNLKKMLLGKNFPEIVTEKDLRIPDEKATIMGWSGRKYWDNILDCVPIETCICKPIFLSYYKRQER